MIAYLSNQFPCAVEPYIADEILELRTRGAKVLPCSARRSREQGPLVSETLYLQPLQLWLLMRSVWLCLSGTRLMKGLFARVLLRGTEPLTQRLRALLHTWLGAYYALLLRDKGVTHIHVHHGYFASWVAMVAAQLLGIPFSMTLHGSDLLLHGAYLDVKLENCKFCFTVSEFNKKYLLEHCPQVSPNKIMVQRMGVDMPGAAMRQDARTGAGCPLVMLAVGRLHAVKDHRFLLQACRRLKDRGFRFLCLIAGEGPERGALERQVQDLGLQAEVTLLGHVSRQMLATYYATADLAVLTSRSEGIPLVLMEAMAYGAPVLAPAITGIPELVTEGKTGFLYQRGSFVDFVAKVEMVANSRSALGPMRRAAREHVLQHFNRAKNLVAFADLFLALVAAPEAVEHESPVLQQI